MTSYSEVIDCERGHNFNMGTVYIKWQKIRSVIVETTKKYHTKEEKADCVSRHQRCQRAARFTRISKA